MNDELNNVLACPRPEIAAYIDGELTVAEEAEFDLHLVGCSLCSTVLNEQKMLLTGLDMGLPDAAIELPEGFEKVIATRAESSVAGIRRSSELFSTVVVCTGLLFLIGILVSIGTGGRAIAATAFVVMEQVAALAVFVGYVVYSIFLGVTVVLRSIASQFRLDLLLTTALVFVSVVSLMLASRRWLRSSRV